MGADGACCYNVRAVVLLSLIHISFEVSITEVITAQAASGFLASLLEAHAAFGKCKVTFAFSGRTLCQVDTPARSTVGEIWFWNLDIAGDLMIVAEILINVGSGYFRCV